MAEKQMPQPVVFFRAVSLCEHRSRPSYDALTTFAGERARPQTLSVHHFSTGVGGAEGDEIFIFATYDPIMYT